MIAPTDSKRYKIAVKFIHMKLLPGAFKKLLQFLALTICRFTLESPRCIFIGVFRPENKKSNFAQRIAGLPSLDDAGQKSCDVLENKTFFALLLRSLELAVRQGVSGVQCIYLFVCKNLTML